MALETGSIIGGKYVLERLLGQGGMGSVWLSRHVTLGAPVAIKFLRSDLPHTQLTLTRFEREAKAAANLHTRHVVKVHDYGVDRKHAYIVMEMLEGEDLGTRLKRIGRLAPDDVLRIVIQVAKGLNHAHEAGIIHRDLKPANIFLQLADGEEVVKILDFGVAKFTGDTPSSAQENTKTGVLLGSPHYMSPEHIRGLWKLLDHRSDLWSLGVIAYRALTSQMPFPGDVLADVMLSVCHGTPAPVTTLVTGLPPAMDTFFAQALARDPDARFQNAHALAAAFTQALGRTSSRWSLPDDSGTGGMAFTPMPGALHRVALPADAAKTDPLREDRTPVMAEPVSSPPTKRSSRVVGVVAAAVLTVLGTAGWAMGRLSDNGETRALATWIDESVLSDWADARDKHDDVVPAASTPNATPPPAMSGSPASPSSGQAAPKPRVPDFGY